MEKNEENRQQNWAERNISKDSDRKLTNEYEAQLHEVKSMKWKEVEENRKTTCKLLPQTKYSKLILPTQGAPYKENFL